MKIILRLLILAQVSLSLRVILRFILGTHDKPIHIEDAQHAPNERAAVIVPILNEVHRLVPCLECLLSQGAEVREIIVVDGGSNDGSQLLVSSYSQKDTRIRLVDASPVPATWNGKAWGLQVGLQSVSPDVPWILTVDADVRPEAPIVKAMLGRASCERLAALSVATLQEVDGFGGGLLHPSLLATLVYRFGIPNKIFRKVSEVQANGQCFLFDRKVLESVNGFNTVRTSLCEDVTIARLLVSKRYRVGFYEAGALVRVKMYENWREMWLNWPRSLPMHDAFSGWNTLLGWLEIFFVQAIPLPSLVVLLMMSGLWRERNGSGLYRGRKKMYRASKKHYVKGCNELDPYMAMIVNVVLTAMRVGVLFGTARTYEKRPWSYWLSPLCDVPVVLRLGKMALQRRHIWRGRVMVRDEYIR